MQHLWQDFVAISVVGTAAVYLLRCLWLARSSQPSVGCGSGCSGCSAAPVAGSESVGSGTCSTIVPIDQLGTTRHKFGHRGGEMAEPVRQITGLLAD